MPIFRRRPLAPRWRAPGRIPPAAREALLRLQQAHRLLAEGADLQAAAIFAELADDAAVYGFRRAPQLNLQAGRAYILGSDPRRGLERIRRGLALMAQMGQLARLPQVAARVLAELRTGGLGTEADALEDELRGSLPGLVIPSVSAEAPQPANRRLPAKCPYCGGSINPGTVEWLDEASAACDYCGSTLPAQA